MLAVLSITQALESVSLKELYELVEERNRVFQIIILLIVSTSIVLSALGVYLAGGSYVVYTHTMYVPIVIASLVFGVRGGILAAVVGGFLLGPIMPLDVLTGEAQSTLNWTFRMSYFLLIAFIIGGSSELIKDYIHRIRWRLLHSGDSDLPNRQALLTTVARLLPTVQSGIAPTLYLIDIVNMNELSLKLGVRFEPVAQATLVARFRDALPLAYELFQVRTNRFALLCREEESLSDSQRSDLIEGVINQPVEFEGIPLLLHCVWSDLQFDDSQLSAEDYMRRLEMALNEARVRKLHHFRYTRSLGLTATHNLEILGLLKHALDDDSLRLRFQPKYSLQDRSIVGVETLMHWTDPGRGIIPSGEFIPIAESSLLVTPLTLWVIERAVQEYKSLCSEGRQLSSIAVNVSAANLGHQAFVDGVKSIVSNYGLDKDVLELELTESAVVEDLGVAVQTLNRIAELGVKISVDDFGTGFSSLQYLDRLPVSSIKIDQSFIRNMLNNANNQAIVESTINLAHRLGLSVVAEGIETEAVEDALRSLGCDYGQGYFFSRPMSADKLREFLQAGDRD